MAFGAFYASAAAAGMAITEMRNMSWWQFSEAIDGFVASKTSEPEGLSQDEEDGLAEMLSAPV